MPFNENEWKAIKYVGGVYDPQTEDVSDICRNIVMRVVGAGLQEIRKEREALAAAEEAAKNAEVSDGDTGASVEASGETEAVVSDSVEGQAEPDVEGAGDKEADS